MDRLQIRVLQLDSNRPECLFQTSYRESPDGVLLAPSYGVVGLAEGSLLRDTGNDIKIMIVTEEFLKYFRETTKVSLFSFENKLAWTIPLKYWPLDVEMDDFPGVTWNVCFDEHQQMSDILPDFFPEGVYFDREEIFGPPPQNKNPQPLSGQDDDAPFQLYISYTASHIGYNNNDREMLRYCSKHNIIVFFDKKHRSKSFQCPVCRTKM